MKSKIYNQGSHSRSVTHLKLKSEMSEPVCELLLFSMILNYNYVIVEPLDAVAEYGMRRDIESFQ
jgi:hypothetical protein